MDNSEKIQEIRQKLREVRNSSYSIDQFELGKILIIVSTTLLIFSAHTALSFKSAAESVDRVNSDLDSVEGIINSNNFQNAMDVLRSLNSRAITQQVNTVVSAFNGLESSIEASNNVEEDLRSKYQLYQWLALIAIMGDVAGIAVIYL